jgi:hypothetical protein
MNLLEITRCSSPIWYNIGKKWEYEVGLRLCPLALSSTIFCLRLHWWPVSTWKWRRSRRRLLGCGRPSPQHHRWWARMRTLQHKNLTHYWVRIWILNWKKEESYTCDPSKREVEGSPGVLRRKPYGERLADCTNYVNHLLLNWIRQIEHIWHSYVQYP